MTSPHHAEFLEILGPLAADLVVVDIGAHGTGETEVYAALLHSPAARVIGFEPNREECRRLNSSSDSRRSYLPYAIGDGQPGTFYICRSPLTSSLLEPDQTLLSRYENLSDPCTVVAREPLDTARLDDIGAIARADFLKIDIQGMTLPALAGAGNLLTETLVVHAETEFVPIYRGESLFSEIELHLRARGFMFHHFHRVEGRRILTGDSAVGTSPSQTLWADAVFVPDHARLERSSPPTLARLAWILHAAYGATDFAMHCVARIDAQCGGRHAERYRRLLADHGLLS